jgi:hypothetical protein
MENPKSPKIDVLWQLRDYYIRKCLKFSKDLFFNFFKEHNFVKEEERE